MMHMGMTAGRRDDMESLCYTLVEIGTGGLPWKTGTDWAEIVEQKRQIKLDELC